MRIALIVLLLIGGIAVPGVNALNGFTTQDYVDLTASTPEIVVTGGLTTETGQVLGAATELEIDYLDWRAYVFDEFFRTKNSPMVGTGNLFVKYCEKYGAPTDCSVIPAIAGAETNWCKYYRSHDQRNCWGFGGPPGYRMEFGSYDEAINLITDRLVNQYPDEFLRNPGISARWYCGTGPECTVWTRNVNYSRYQLSQFSVSLGFPALM